MTVGKCWMVAMLALAASLPAWILDRSAGAEEIARNATEVKVGVASSLFRDTPKKMIPTFLKPLKRLFESETGFTGNISDADPLALGNQLADDKVQLGVFHGFEFAWVKMQHPNLKPIILAVNTETSCKVHVIVRDDSTANDLSDLKGTKIVIAQHTLEHCHLFLERKCGAPPSKYFAEVSTPLNFEDALDSIVDGEADVILIDGASLATYTARKPGCAKHLKTLVESEAFPHAVVACNPSNFGEADQKKFRKGMMHANETPKGQQLLMLCRITSFEDIPADFDKELDAIAKNYPPPEPPK